MTDKITLLKKVYKKLYIIKSDVKNIYKHFFLYF